MLVEAAQHVVRGRSHIGVVATQSGYGDAESMAGHELEAVDHALCQAESEGQHTYKQDGTWRLWEMTRAVKYHHLAAEWH